MSTVVSARPSVEHRTSVSITGLADRRNRFSSAPPRPTLVRECDRRPELFDLPDGGSVESQANPITGTDGAITLAAVAEQAADVARFARKAAQAVDACRRCPFLQQCRREATERIMSGQRPQGEVRAAVAFNNEGLPEPAVHHKPRRRELEQLTFDMDLHLSGVTVTPDTDWLPADLEPTSTADDLAVTMALDDIRVNATVTQSHLDSKAEAEQAGRIVLNYTDEIELLRRGLAEGRATNRLAQIVGIKWQRIAEIAHILGRTPDGKFSPSDWAVMRRTVVDIDTITADARTEAAVREQQARDRLVLLRDHIHDQVLDLADRAGIRLLTGPPPVSSRILRTEAVAERSATITAFSGLARAS